MILSATNAAGDTRQGVAGLPGPLSRATSEAAGVDRL